MTFPTILTLIAVSGFDARVQASVQPPCAAPPAPTGATAVVNGRAMTLTWKPSPSAPPTTYTVETGDAAGSSYLGTTDVGEHTSISKTVEPGVYYLRVIAANACGRSAPSRELRVVVDEAHIGVRSKPDVIVAQRTAARNTYFPTLTMTQSGELIAVFYDSRDHVSREGRIAMVRSGDQGRTWSAPTVVIDGPNDERDPNIIETARGTWLLSYFEADTMRAPAAQGVFVVRSTDRGRTWSSPIKVGTSLDGAGTSAKIVQLENNDLLIPIYGTRPAGRDYIASIVRSGDDGATWPAGSEVTLAAAAGVSFVEPAIASLGDGRLLAMIRTEAGERIAYETTSIDNGRTWSAPARTTLVAQASDLLPVADGGKHFLVHTWSDTSGRFGDSRPTVMQIVAFREFPRARWTGEPRLLYQGHCWSDEGYPSSVHLRDGRILTIYYDACAGYIGGTFSTLADPAASADCSDPPGAVQLEVVSNAAGTVTFAWTAAGAARMSYILEAGTAAGATDALAVDVGAATTYGVSQVKAGTYYVRVRASNACGSSPASNEAVVVVP